MAAKPPQRDLIRIIINNFINSLRPRQFKGNLVGEDYFGNKYYEIPPNLSIGKRNASRYFVPTDKEAFDQELTAEWEAWLRGRREEPPSKEELVKNLSIMEMKRHNAAEIDATFAEKDNEGKQLPKQKETIGTFPKYDEYEIVAGKDPEKK
ncbi:NADH dehydrogenase [ubiquinone] 1 alpha subcomplex assembly factor 2 [Eurosta solidaginis]|uniref:NADH dehydrogenase [ubiquinone] 1 alpha subcomplex assembly factor 2 n=1 Tax=Eurosta solidaginis TaxID=178769 RepID=UPI003530B3A3